MKASSFYCSLMKYSFSDHGGIVTCWYLLYKGPAECEYQVFAYSDGSGAWGLGECSFRREPETGGEISGRESGVDSQKPERYESL